MNNGKQSEQLLKVLGGHSASLDRTSKCRGLSEQPLYSDGHKAMQHETRNWNSSTALVRSVISVIFKEPKCHFSFSHLSVYGLGISF